MPQSRPPLMTDSSMVHNTWFTLHFDDRVAFGVFGATKCTSSSNGSARAAEPSSERTLSAAVRQAAQRGSRKPKVLPRRADRVIHSRAQCRCGIAVACSVMAGRWQQNEWLGAAGVAFSIGDLEWPSEKHDVLSTMITPRPKLIASLTEFRECEFRQAIKPSCARRGIAPDTAATIRRSSFSVQIATPRAGDAEWLPSGSNSTALVLRTNNGGTATPALPSRGYR